MPDPRTIAVYDIRAADYAHLTKAPPRPDLRAFIAAMPQAARVLDLGCGPGAAAVHMQSAGLQIDAIDASAAMVAMARKAGIPARVATFDDVTQIEVYHGVWANFSLLHAAPADLPRHIGAIAKALVPGGLFHIGMKLGDGQARDAIDRLYTYVTTAALTDMLADVGLRPVSTREGVDKGLAGTDDAFVVIQALKDKNA